MNIRCKQLTPDIKEQKEEWNERKVIQATNKISDFYKI